MFVLNTPVVIFNHKEYGSRLLFKNGIVNPRDELGKNGVTFHNGFASYFYKTITIEAMLINEKGERSKQVFHINRNSLIKYLGNVSNSKCSDEELFTALQDKLWKGDNNSDDEQQRKIQDVAGAKGLRHAGQHNQQKLNSGLFEYIKTSFLGWLYQATIGSMIRMFIRTFFVNTEKDLLTTGELLAKQRFHEAYAQVPAYKLHMITFNQKSISEMTFRDIPVTTKENYIKPQTFPSNTHTHGKFPERSKTDTSTGTTGKPTEWVRGEAELQTVKKSLQFATKMQFGERRLSYINAFALGPWATGLTTYELMRETGSVFATGPDKDKILDKLLSIQGEERHQLVRAIAGFSDRQKNLLIPLLENVLKKLLDNPELTLKKVLSQTFGEAGEEAQSLLKKYSSKILSIAEKLNAEKQQIILAGYPPFLKDFTAFVEANGLDMKSFSVVGIVGGQGMSEAMRDQLIAHGFSRVLSSYGASDLDINLGSESHDAILLRKAIEKNPGLQRELYGLNKGLPMVFEMDPMNYHVEVDDEDELIFTCARTDRSSPRIRYDLGDKGRIYASSDVQALLTKYGIFHKPKTNLPLLFVWGRESMVVFNGANLGFTELERSITENVALEKIVLKKAFYTYYDEKGDERLEIWLELNDEVDLPSGHEAKKHALNILTKLAELNQDFRYQLEKLDDGTDLPWIRFFKRGESPISEAGGHRKQVLVFQKDVNLPKDYVFPGADKMISTTTVMTREILKGNPAELRM